MVINEKELLNLLDHSTKVALVEPQYKRKYIPLGLAKIGGYLEEKEVSFHRTYQANSEDLVCITSLFTYDVGKVIETISSAKFMNPMATIIVGGVMASLMPDYIEGLFPNIKIFTGYSKTLDQCKPIDLEWQLDEPWNDFSFVFTTRGCPNKCAYCAVWRIEPERWINPKWKDVIDLHKPNIMISDNNLSAQPLAHIVDVCNFVKDNNKRVVFDNGFDCKHITSDLAEKLAMLKYTRTGLRLAFDRIEEDGIFQDAIRTLNYAGVKSNDIMAYVLFNFNDTPREAIYRAEECVKLGVRPYPQCYKPLNSISRNDHFLGKHWTTNLVRAYRFFFLMAGYYGKSSFIDWIKSDVAKEKGYKLTSEDWKALSNGVI